MSDTAMAWMQFFIGIMFIFGFFAVLILFLLGYVKVPIDYKEAFIGLLGVVTGTVVQILSYFFARQRNAVALPSTSLDGGIDV